MKQFLLAILLLFGTGAFGQEIEPSSKEMAGIPVPVPTNVKTPSDEFAKLSWTHFAVADFSVLSLDREQGLYLSQNIEQIKAWILERWGLDNVNFTPPAVIVAVPNKDMMKKLFQLDRSYSEIRMKDGKIALAVAWVVLDDEISKVVPNALTPICMAEFKQLSNYKMPFWTVRGMSMLNLSLAQIRANIVALKDHKINTNKILDIDEQRFLAMPLEEQQKYDKAAMVLTLLFRKEYGQFNFNSYIKGVSLQELGLSATELQSIYDRYLINLTNDVSKGITPDSYLQIKQIGEM